MKKVLMLVRNDIVSDSRVKRMALTLSEKRSVLLLGTRSNRARDEEEAGNLEIKRIGPRAEFPKPRIKTFPFGVIADARNFFDNYKISLKGGRIAFSKISKFNYQDYAKINLEEEKEEIKVIRDINYLFYQEGKKNSADIIHCNDLDTLLSGVILKKKFNSRLVYDAHEIFSEQFTNRSRKWKDYFSMLEKKIISYADAVITVNPSISQELVERYSISAPHVIYNCSEAPPRRRRGGIFRFRIPSRSGILGQKPNICALPDMAFWRMGKLISKEAPKKLPFKAKGRKIVLFHGRIDMNRGLPELVEAFKYVERAVLAIRGEGPLIDYLKEQVNKGNLKEKVHFLSPVSSEEIIHESSWADIGIIPYIPNSLNNFYCSPNKLFEYMMAGLAVLASSLPELRRIILQEKLGDVFDPHDPKDIAGKINILASDDNLLLEAKANSRKAALEKYNWEKESLKLLRIYEEL